MGEIRLPYSLPYSLPYRLSKSDDTSSSPPPEKIRLGSPKSFLLWFFASSPPPERSSSSSSSNSKNNIGRTSSSLSSSCFHTSRSRLSDASFCMKLDFEEADGTSSKVPHDINEVEEEADKKIERAAQKMSFLNSVNEVLSMERMMVLKKMKKVMGMKEKKRKRKRNHDGGQVWYEKEVKGIRCKPMRDGSFRIIRTAEVVQPPAMMVAEEDGGVVACEIYEK